MEADSVYIPTERDGSFRLRYSAGTADRVFRADQLDSPEAGALRGAIVIIGPPGAQVKTPMGLMSEASVLAEGLQDLLSGQVLHRPAYARLAEAVWLALFGVGAILLLLRYGLGWASGPGGGGHPHHRLWLLVPLYGLWPADRRRQPGGGVGAGAGGGGHRQCARAAPQARLAAHGVLRFAAPRHHREDRAAAFAAEDRWRDPHRHLSGVRGARAGGDWPPPTATIPPASPPS